MTLQLGLCVPDIAMSRDPLLELRSSGQSLWLDRIERRLIDNKALERLIEDDAFTGALSNLAALRHAITSTDDYWAGIAELERRKASPEEVYERLLLYDVGRAAHAFRRLHQGSGGIEGYVSICVSPRLAHNSETSINEARRLWKLIDRPNIMIAVAGTPEGIRAMQQLVIDGINVNVTPLFSVARYAEALSAYTAGLEKRLFAGDPIDRIASVVSFWPAALDQAIDAILDAIGGGTNSHQIEAVRLLHGQIGVACASLAYWQLQEHCDSIRWRALASHGARKQRLLWITSANTADTPLRCLDRLMAPDTISAVSVDLLDRYRAQGNPRPVLHQAQARERLSKLAALDIDLQSLQRDLENRAGEDAVNAYDTLLATLASKLGRQPR
jgi:transaldolase